jgi:hypothetical protein
MCEPERVTPEQFLHRCPALWHVAPAGAWSTIRETGLRTAAQLIDASDLDPEQRRELAEAPRPAAVALRVDGAEVQLSDQAVFVRPDLPDVLDAGVSVADWVQLLNRRVYLYADRAALDKALAKLVERDGAQEVISFSPRRLLDTAPFQIELAAQNTSTIARRAGASKGRDTFRSISRSADKRPAEVTIVDGLEDLASIVRVERHDADGTRTSLR